MKVAYLFIKGEEVLLVDNGFSKELPKDTTLVRVMERLNISLKDTLRVEVYGQCTDRGVSMTCHSLSLKESAKISKERNIVWEPLKDVIMTHALRKIGTMDITSRKYGKNTIPYGKRKLITGLV